MDIDTLTQRIPGCVRATYTPQRLPQFRGNPLIEALPPSMSDEELLSALTLLPGFNPEQREWPTYERLQMLLTLQNFMIPLARHTDLARALDSMIRAGYVGRAPQTAEHAKIFQSIYEKQKAGVTFSQCASTRAPQLSSSLVGLSGMGKTTTVTRWLAHIPQIIYHPDYNLYQVPYLHIEMPSDGSSIKGLAYAILHKLDELIPGSHYYEDYTARGRTGADALMRSVARLMNIHLVGILICDEVQNLANSNKGAQTVMTELVSACNDLKVPILFIGTNKARKVLSLDFRQSRRSCGNGIAPWDRLVPASESAEIDEWREFIEVLWHHQFVKNPTPLDHQLLDVMYFYSQGVIDVAIKIFASVQARAMLDGSERITVELIADVFENELQLLHPMIEALRNNDIEALSAFDDIAPLRLHDLVDDVARKLRNRVSPRFTTTQDETSPSFAQEPITTPVAVPRSDGHAMTTAELAQGEGPKETCDSSPARTISRRSKYEATATGASEIDFDKRPQDYRRAIFAAKSNQTSVLRELSMLGHTPGLDELIDLA